MRLINCTDHPVALGEDPYAITILPSGQVARCMLDQRPSKPLQFQTPLGVVSIPVMRSQLGEVKGLPGPALRDGVTQCPYCHDIACGDDLGIRNCADAPRYIVSRLVVDALPQRSDLFAPRF